MDFLFYLKMYCFLYADKILTIAGAILVLSALAALLIIRLVKKKKEAQPQQSLSQASVQLPDQQKYFENPAVQKKKQQVPHPDYYQMPADPRTVLMSYSTVVLRDALCHSRCYRADLVRPVMVGRSKENAICISDDSVSRCHLRIYRDGGVVMVENLSQKNGTLLEGIRLAGVRELKTGSILQLGRVRLVAEID